jgi:hypothetical protein
MNLNAPIKLNAAPIKLGAIMLALLFAVYVWPTPYRYAELSRRDRYLISTFLVRINRFTGRADVLTPHQGWICYGNCPSGTNQTR